MQEVARKLKNKDGNVTQGQGYRRASPSGTRGLRLLPRPGVEVRGLRCAQWGIGKMRRADSLERGFGSVRIGGSNPTPLPLCLTLSRPAPLSPAHGRQLYTCAYMQQITFQRPRVTRPLAGAIPTCAVTQAASPPDSGGLNPFLKYFILLNFGGGGAGPGPQ